MSGNSDKLNNKVSPHINDQLPGFVKEDHPLFVTFLKHYYQFLEAGELTLGGSNDFVIQETNTVNYLLNENDDFLVLESSTGKFQAGEIIRGEQSGYTATILVDDYDGTKRLFISSQQKFITGENVVGQSSGAKAPVVSYRANPIQNIQQLLAYADVDNTVFSFLEKFKQALMESLPETLADEISKRKLIKNIKDLYEAKGTEEGHKLFFRILFDEEASLVYPRENVLRVSNGQWSDDFVMRVVENGTSNFSELIGRRITGSDSEASAVVQTIVKYKSGNVLVAELNLDRNTITGDFVIGETVTGISNVIDQKISATVSGIVDEVQIIDGGRYYDVGDVVTFEKLGSVGVQGQVSQIGSGSIDHITCCAGGTGYTYDDLVVVNNANTNGVGLAAKISVLGGSFELEENTDPDNFHLEDDTDIRIIVDHGDKLIFEDGSYIGSEESELYSILIDGTNALGADSGDQILLEDGNRLVSEFAPSDFQLLREESASYFMQQEVSTGKLDRLVFEDGGQIIIEEETFNDLGVPSEIGAITKITVTNPGLGYTKLPTISIDTSTGSGALNYAVSESGVGRILGVNITNLGLEYTGAPDVSFYKKVVVRSVSGSFSVGDTFTSHTATVVSFDPVQSLLELNTPIEHFIRGDVLVSATGATATVVDCGHAVGSTRIVAVGNSGGVFITDRGKVSETSMKVQDSFFYQDYSYVVRVGQSINQWRDSVKRSIHPGGWNVFGEVSFATSFADAQLNSLRIRNPAAGDVIDYIGDDRYTPELASMFETLFTAVFGRRLGTKTDGTVIRSAEDYNLLEDNDFLLLETGDKFIISIPNPQHENYVDGKLPKTGRLSGDKHRDVTLTSFVSVRMDGGRLGQTLNVLGPTLDLLPKYAFSQPPVDTYSITANYPGIYREIRGDSNHQWRIDQFGGVKISDVSVRSNSTGRGDFSDTTDPTFDNNTHFNAFDETNIIIPLSAYRTKINVPPPGEIVVSKGLLINAYDNTFISFDNVYNNFSEALSFGDDRFDSNLATFDEADWKADNSIIKFDTDQYTYDPVTFDEVVYPRATAGALFTSFDEDGVRFDNPFQTMDFGISTKLFSSIDNSFDVNTITLDETV